MNLVSKNAPLEVSINRMQAILSEMGCDVTYSSEKHPLNHCYSVNLASVEAPKHIYSNGKGIYSEASTASALGEYIERLQTNNFFIDFHLPERKYYPDEVAFAFAEGYLNAKLSTIYDPGSELSMDELIDFNSDYEDKIVALPFHKLASDEVVYFPLNILSNLYVSNGLATGNTAQEAQVQAMSEILERYAKIEIIKNGYALPHYSDEFLRQFERLYSDLIKLRELGYIVNVLDASLGGKYPVTAISFINPANATLFVSFGRRLPSTFYSAAASNPCWREYSSTSASPVWGSLAPVRCAGQAHSLRSSLPCSFSTSGRRFRFMAAPCSSWQASGSFPGAAAVAEKVSGSFLISFSR